MQEYDELVHLVGPRFHMKPSQGNIKDGLITDAIQSTGAAKKGGTSPMAMYWNNRKSYNPKT